MKIKKSNSFADNILVFLLILGMILCQIPCDVFAEENTSTLTLKMNNVDMTLPAAGDFSNAQKVKYGDPTALTLEPSSEYSGDVTFMYVEGNGIPDESTTWKIWTPDVHPTEPGNYYLGYQTTVNKVATYKADSTYGFTIEKAQLAAPAGEVWSGGSKAVWDTVAKTVSGTNLDSGAVSGYEVKLYKDGAEVKTVTTTETSYDFTDDIKAACGDYTFTAAAVSGVTAHYTNSAAASSGITKAVAVTISKDGGITSVSPESAILVSGNTSLDSVAISAVVKSGRTFDSWSSSDAGVAITDSSKESTTATVPADYSGADVVTLTAATADKTAPIIKTFTAGTGDKYGYLQGTADDLGGGITAYTFSTKSDKSSLQESDWTVLDNAEENASCEQKVSAAGKYYFYIKDSSGNITGSNDTIQATEVIYHNYYSNNNATDKTEYMVGSEALTLADSSRTGYDFGGWYDNSDFSGNAVSEINTQSGTAVNVYGKWTREVVKISAQPQNINTTYDGKNHELSVSVSNTAGTVSYQWLKGETEIKGATSATYNVKNVSDSGNYKVRVTVTVDGTDVTEYSNVATVVISKKDLTVTATDITVTFGEAVPDYSFTASGFAGSENADVLTAGTYECGYVQGSGAGKYDITPKDFSADNYEISYAAGKLTVSAKSIDDLTISLDNSNYTYTGNGIEPAVTVKDGMTDVDKTNYTVSYTDNVNKGTAKAIVTFKNNYTGEKTLEFTISKADFTAEADIADWIYGNSAPETSITNNPGSGKVSYYYTDSENGEGTTIKPSDAGKYYIYAEVAETANYNKCITPRKEFEIKKRSITLTAMSKTWIYDGTAHSNSDYTQTGTMAGSDGFQKILVEGTITDAGTVADKVVYTLTSSTNANNYAINCIDGTLTVTADTLLVPTECNWSSISAGTATWICGTKAGVNISYKVQLYRVGTSEAIAEENTTDDSYDFSKIIKDDCEKQTQSGQYYFRVSAVPSEESNQSNYTASAYSDASKYINTIKLTTVKATGIANLTGVSEGISYLIQGETVKLSATLDTGYSFANSVWTSSGAISVADSAKSITTITASSLIASPAEATLTANSNDDLPVIGSFDANYAEDGKAILSLTASDSKGIRAWAITNSSDAPEDTEWQTLTDSQTGITETVTVSTKGTYYAWVKDGINVVGGDKYKITIYQIGFNGNGGTGTMSSLLKIQNKTLTLPANKYTKEGYTFQTWKGSTGSYGDSETYEANSDDTLTAQWSNQKFSYTVEYYYMDTDGSYLTAPSETKTFEGSYGDVISTDSDEILQNKAGLTIDTSKNESITLTGNGEILEVYYQRNKYTITYSYTIPGDTAATSKSVEFYYNQSVTEIDKPLADGYTFVGWEYDDFGTKPETMPLRNIKASGSFTANGATYNINYYEKNLTGDAYTLIDSATEIRTSKHDAKISFANNDANTKSFEGFSVEGITVTSGSAGGSNPNVNLQASITATISAIEGQTTNINYYYTRNKYKLTLNVYKDNRETNIYSYPSEITYGTPITASYYANYGKDDWTKNRTDMEEYVLASYADWSTGSAPATMPAADITVSRDYEKNLSSFLVEVYYEKGYSGKYEKQSILTYYAKNGSTATVGDSESDTVNIEDFKNYIYDFTQYEYDSSNTNNITSGTVTSDGTMKLKVYFKGKQTDTTVNYYYRSGTNSILIGSVKINGNVGMNYSYNPAMLFGTVNDTPSPVEGTYTSNNQTIGGISAEKYDFLSNKYVIFVSGYYYDGESNWPGGGYIYDADGLAETKTATYGYGEMALGKNYANRMNIYYAPVPQKTQYYLDVVHTPYNYLAKAPAEDKNLPLTVVNGGTTYKIRVTNESNIYEASWEDDTAKDYSGYPGGTSLNGKWKVTEPRTLRSGWHELTIGSNTYYTDDNDDGDYIYLADTANQFYEGHYASYNFLDAQKNPDKLGYSTVEDYLSKYKTEHSDSGNTDTYDDYTNGAYIYNGGFNGFMGDNSTYTFTYRYKIKYNLTYYLSNKYKTVAYPGGTEVTPETYSDTFSSKDGCTIVWYTDSAFKNHAAKFTINSNTMLYGRYERNTVTYHKYAYYQLGDPVSIEDTSTLYITKDNINLFKSDITSKSTSEAVDFTDGVGTTSSKTVTTTKYYYKGDLVMTDVVSPVLTYTEVSIDPADEKYVVSGFNYEETNAKNVLNQTVIADGTGLSIYYARNVHSVVKITDAQKTGSAVTDYYRYGHTVSIDAPKKNGYQFKNWICKIKDASTGEWSDWTEAPTFGTDGSGSFIMPDKSLEMTAVWEPASFDTTVIHYFQNKDKTYGKDTLKQFATYNQSFTTVSVDGTDVNACEFINGGNVVGIAVPESLKTGGDASKLSDYDKVTYYEYSGLESKPSVNSNDAFAIVIKQKCNSEEVVKCDAYKLTNSAFVYDYTIFENNSNTATLRGSDTFTSIFGMNLAYYYTRNSYSIDAVSKVSDGAAESGATITGAGQYFYRSDAVIRAIVLDGYTFKGWYKAKDVLEGYDDSAAVTLDSYNLKSDISGVEKISDSASYTVKVDAASNYVAVVDPIVPLSSDNTITISGGNSYKYGYSKSDITALNANVTTDTYDYVSSYQWYEGDKKIEGATTSAYLIPTGKASGSYNYKCVAVIKNKYNGRNIEISSENYTVTVGTAGITYKETDYKGIYDGLAHGIDITVDKTNAADLDYTIYYSTDKELTAENYQTDGITEAPVFTDVKMTDGTVAGYTVYYYIHSKTKDYQDIAGNGTVTISPKTITLKSVSAKTFAKTYDGSNSITGDALTSLEKEGYYAFIGLTAADADNGYIISCSAEYNSKDVKTADVITLSDIKLTDKNGNINSNYILSSGYTLKIPGIVTPKKIAIKWGSNAFTYNGTAHIPEVNLAEGAAPVTGENVTVKAQGAQINAGTYTASASFVADDSYDINNYQISGDSTCNFTIAGKELSITPKNNEVTYDGQNHKIIEFDVNGLSDGQTYTAETDKTDNKNAGTYTVKAVNGKVFSSDGKDVTDNYTISYGSASLVIKPKTVTFYGITANDKIYDGSKAAALDVNELKFDGIVDGDNLILSELKGTFDTANVGKDKTVTISGAVLAGTSAANYTMSETGNQMTATASISQAELTVTAADVSTIYGNDAAFTSEITGFINDENSDTANVSGSVVYKIKNSSGSTAAYDKTTAAGTYDIVLDLSELKAENYTFKAGSTVKLNVEKREITVAAADNAKITKIYDGTTSATVKTSDYVFSNIVNGDEINLKYTAAYNSAKVAEAENVIMSGLSIDNANYKLATTTFNINGSVSKAQLKVTAVNKTITYGDNAPEYSVTYSGFVNNETSSVISGTPEFVCAYDNTNENKRSAVKYSITPSGLSSSNYEISYIDGTLSVNKAKITVTADDKSITYGDNLPDYTGKYSGFKYGDTASVITGTPVYTCTANTTSAAGTYDITVNVSGMSAANYDFSGVKGKLTIVRHAINISGITVNDKIYDGTTNVTALQIVTGSVNYEGILEADKKNEGINVSNAKYNVKDAGSRTVNFTVSLNSYLAARYTVGTAQNSAPSNITTKDLTVTADDKSIIYGSTVPSYTYKAAGFANGESVTNLSGSIAYECSYKQNDSVNTYIITPSGFTSTNYNIKYENGTLTVNKAKLTTPTVSWSSTLPGTVTWTKSAQIGSIAVSGYELKLYKDGETEPVYTDNTLDANAVSKDLLETIRSKGAGKYFATISAIASETDNALKVNVADSDDGKSGYKYAAEISIGYAADEISQAGKSSISVHDESAVSYVVVAGEQSIPLMATLKNATGYSVSSWTSDNGNLTFSNQIQTETSVTASANISYSLNATAVKITLALKATAATLSASISASKMSVDYKYPADAAPVLTATASPESDNVTADQYDYSYQWYFKDGPWGTMTKIEQATSSSYTMPIGFKAAANWYKYKCEITATRKDNGEKKSEFTDTLSLSVNLIEFTNATVTMDDWKYGDVRKAPSTTTQPEEIVPVITYSSDGGTTWVNAIPKNVGNYKVRADYAQSTNYKEKIVEDTFEITAAKLAEPSGLETRASSTAPYGQASWQAVTGPKENNGITGDSDSNVSVKYEVSLYRDNEKLTAITTDKTNYDFTSYYSETGTYKFKVKALATCSNGNENNCADSDEAASDDFIISKSMSGGSYEKTYDGKAIILTAVGGDDASYQWLCDNKEVSGATKNIYDTTYVEQNGTYVCRITVNGSIYYSPNHIVNIKPLAITITADSDSKIYDGTPLIKETFTSVTLAEGDSAECTMTSGSTITNVGSVKNTISSVTIKDDTNKTVYTDGGTNNNYTVTKAVGTLTVNHKGLGTGSEFGDSISVDDIASETYTGAEIKPLPAVKYGNNITLLKDTDYTVSYSNNIYVGTATVTITGKGNYSGTITKTFKIVKKAITVTSKDATKTYDGTALTTGGTDNLMVTTGELGSGDTLYGVTFTGTQTAAGSSSNTFGDLKIYKNGTDVTVNYDITQAYGTLTVGKKNLSDKDVSVADIANKTYTGAEIKPVPAVTYAPSGKTALTVSADDYDVIYSENVNKGTATITITAKTGSTNYTGTITKTFAILSKAITVTSKGAAKTYDGTALTMANDVTNLTVSDTTELGTGDKLQSVTFTGTQTAAGSSNNTFNDLKIYKNGTDVTGNYTITRTCGTLTVNARSIGTQELYANDVAVAEITDKIYTGTSITPQPVVTCTGLASAASTTLVSGTDYTVSYSNNIYVGTATVTITGKGNYSGTITKTFKIVKKAITVTSKDATKTYDGTALTTGSTDNLTVTMGELGSGDTLYGVTFTGTQTAAGSSSNTFGDLKIYKNGTDVTVNYDITQAYGTLTVGKKNLSDKDVSVADIANKTYTGAEIKPVPAVTYAPSGKTALTVSADDYDVIYSENVNKGTATITITAKTGSTNYTGTITKTFAILSKAITVTSKGAAKTYDGTALTMANDVTNLTVSDTTELGTGDKLQSVTFTGTQTAAGSSNNTFNDLKIYKNGTDVTGNYTIIKTYGTLTVNARSIGTQESYANDIAVAEITDKIYTGTSITPQPVVTCTGLASAASTTLVSGTDYTVSYSNNIYVGTATVTITGKGNYSGTITKTFKIVKKAITVTSKDATKIYDGTALTTGGTDNLMVTTGELGSGDALGSVNFIGTQTDVGAISNEFDNVKIVKGSEDVTANYTITPEYGQLTVTEKNLGSGNTYGDKITVDTISDKIYIGSAIEPEPVVKYTSVSTLTLVKGTDYNVSYENNVNKGTATITITGIGNYSGAITKPFKIVNAEMEVTANDYSGIYDGASHSINVSANAPSSTAVVYYSTSELTAENYSTSGSKTNPAYTNVGTYKVYYYIVADNYDAAEGSKTVTISAKAIGDGSEETSADITATADLDDKIFNGSAFTPAPTVKYSLLTDKTLKAGTDYTVSYTDNTKVGTATITITGIGNYSGAITKPFKIVNAEMEVTANDYSGIYDGASHSINVSANAPSSTAVVYYSTSELTAENYSTSGSKTNPAYTNVGTYKVYYYIVADNYDAAEGSKTVTISAKAIGDGSEETSADITATADLDDKIFNGSAFTPAPTVKYSLLTDKTLKAGTDYTVSYTDNTKVGTATITITGIGNYSGAITKPFKIVNAEMEVTANDYSGIYDGASHSINVSANAPSSTAVVYYSTSELTAENYSASGSKTNPAYTNVGTYKVYYYIVADNYDAAEGSKTVTISAKAIGDGSEETSADITATADLDDKIFNGSAFTPAPTVKYSLLTDDTLKAGTDYTVSYTDNTKVGTAAMTITGKGNYSGAITKTFKIVNAEMEVTANDYSGIYDGDSHSINVSANVPSSTAVVYYSTSELTAKNYSTSGSKTNPAYTNVGTYKVYYYIVADNYDAAEGSKTVTISAKAIGDGSEEPSADITATADLDDKIFNGSAFTPAPTVKYSLLTDDTLKAGTDYTVSYTDNTKVGTAAMTITGKGNYSGSIVKPFKIVNAEMEVTANDYSGIYDGASHSINVSANAPSSTAVVYYSTSKLTAENYSASGSKTNPAYTNVGTYKVYYYIVADNYDAAEGSKTVTISAKAIGDGSEKPSADITATADLDDKIFNGSAFTPAPTVKYSLLTDDTLKAGTDYTVSYTDNTKVGTAAMTITGKGNYSGSIVKPFKIVNAEMEVTANDYSGIYDGASHSINVSANAPSSTAVVYYSTSKLTAENYSASGSKTNPAYTNVGTYKVYYYIVADNYDAAEGSKTVTISAKAIGDGSEETSADITATADLDDKIFNGSAFTPAPTVKYSLLTDDTLKAGTDYTVSYTDNTKVGTAAMTITGKGNYSGAITKTFKIVNAEMEVTANDYSGIYDGASHSINVSANAPSSTAVVYYSTSELTAKNYSTSGSKTNPAYTNVGTYKVYYYIVADNYDAAEGSKTVTISAKAIGDGSEEPSADITATADLDDKIFNGSAFTPAPTVKYSLLTDDTLKAGTDYTVSYTDNTKVGTAAMTITGKGNYSGSIVKPFKIVNAEMEVTANDYSGIYDGASHSINVSANAPSSTAVVYYSTSELTAKNYSTSGSKTNPAYTNVGTYKVYYYIVADNYDAAEGSKTVTISAKAIGDGSEEPSADITATADLDDKIFNGSAFTPAPTVKYSLLTDDTLKAGTDYTVSYTDNTKVGTAAMTITGKGNYSGSIVKTFIIAAKSIGSGTAESYISVSDIADQIYQVAGCEPKLEITCAGLAGENRTLVEGKDYKLSYEDNKAVGTATVTIMGIGNFTGTITKKFCIIAAEAEYKVNDFAGTYDGSEHSGQVVKTSDDTVVYYSTEPLKENNYLTASQNVLKFKVAGIYKVYYYITRPNYKAKEGDFVVKIDKMQPTISAVPESFVYDGKSHKIVATTNGDGTVDCTDNDQIKVGNYKVHISTAETDNCYAADATVEMTITKRNLILTADSGSMKYNSTALTEGGYKVSSGSLAEGDKITSIRISGSQVNAGTSDNSISDAVILSSNGEDVTSCYNISYVSGSLEVIKDDSSTYKNNIKKKADNNIAAADTQNDSRDKISRSKDKADNNSTGDKDAIKKNAKNTDNKGVKNVDKNSSKNIGTIKKNTNNTENSGNMALFNILALVLLIVLAIYSLLRRKNSILNKILNTVIAIAGIILTILTFNTGTLVLFNKISIEFAVLLAASIFGIVAGMKRKNEKVK